VIVLLAHFLDQAVEVTEPRTSGHGAQRGREKETE
jgi:hypothetical protein